MVLVQKWPFFWLFFLGNIGQENVFYDILEEKNAFLGYKNKKIKKSKNWDFSKGVNPWFRSKNGHFSKFFFFTQYRPEKCLLWYSRRTKRLSKLKKQEVQKVENWHFCKGVNLWFWSKNDHFSKGFNPCFSSKSGPYSNFSFFRQYRPGKCLLWYFRRKKRLSKL